MTPIDWSIFANPENIIFFAILGIVVLLFVVIFFGAIGAFFKLIADIFKKMFGREEDNSGEGIEINVEELEESKRERREAEGAQTITGPTVQYNQPAADIASKKIQEEKTETETPVPTKIKIPVAKKFSGEEEKQAQEQAAKFHLGSQTKIPVGKDSSVQYQDKEPIVIADKTPVITSDKSENLKSPAAEKKEAGGTKHESNVMFGKGEEISRINLRQKLRSAEVYQAQRKVGLSLNRIERAKLEKEVFSQALGLSISKTDLKWGLKKLNRKMITSKNPLEKGKIRKEIKFFKKIGGIK